MKNLLSILLFVTAAALGAACGTRPDAPASAPTPTQPPMPGPALQAVQASMTATYRASQLLAADATAGLDAPARAAEAGLTEAAEHLDPDSTGHGAALRGADAARALAQAADLPSARVAFAGVQEALFALAAEEPRLQEGWAAFSCPMVEHFPKWFQPPGPIENPFMGTSMLACGGPEDWAAAAPDDAPAPAVVSHWTCPMHPTIHDAEAGACPICGMDLTPVAGDAVRAGVVRVEEARRAALGVATAPVTRAPLGDALPATGLVRVDERHVHDVTVRVPGTVERLLVEETGASVRAGQTLAGFFSPQLVTAQQDLLAALARSQDPAPARARLRQWGLDAAQIASIEAEGAARTRVALRAPASGVVLEKDVAQGAYLQTGQRLMRIADLTRVQVEAQVFDADLGRVQPGAAVTVSNPAAPGAARAGVVRRILPERDPTSRAARVQVDVENPDLDLQIGQFVAVEIQTADPPVLQVPRDAVLYAGPRRIVFVDRGEGQLAPVEVEIGRTTAASIEIRSGLEEGEEVVASGVFLIAAESRLQAATGFWADGEGTDAR